MSDLVALTANRTPRDLTAAPRGEWSAAQVAAHMADAELVYSVRIRMVLTDENPALVGYDEQAWAARFAMSDVNVAGSVERFRVLRDANLRLFESLEPAEWSRIGTHLDQGELSIASIVEKLIGHDREHLNQIRRLL
ncbi:MAG: hypothetical protein QOJ00_1305 [Actinomycetota bacterium]